MAASEDVPGLVTEADTMEQLIEKLRILSRNYLKRMGSLPEVIVFYIPMHVVSSDRVYYLTCKMLELCSGSKKNSSSECLLF